MINSILYQNNFITTMDANNFKNVFKNIFLNKKREKEEVDNANLIKNNQNEEENPTLNFQNPKKYVKYSDIIQQKIQENNKKEDILKKFDDLDNNEKYGKDVILKVAGMQKLKKQFEEDNKKSSIIIKNKKGEKESEGIIPDKAQKLNLELDEKSNEKNKETDKIENKNSNVNVYSSDSEHEENENEKFTENISSIPKEFELEVCNKEWVVDVDPKK